MFFGNRYVSGINYKQELLISLAQFFSWLFTLFIRDIWKRESALERNCGKNNQGFAR
jgi:hypothetical protein